MLLKDKTLLVTGAGRGIGREIVSVALREGAGVVAHIGRCNNSETSTDTNGDSLFNTQDVQSVYGDLTTPDAIDKIWQDAVNWRSRIDVLINNAGVFAASPLDTAADWQQGWDTNLTVNLTAPAALCRHAIKHYAASGEGIIINMASRSSHRGDDADHLAYGAAKGGLLALTKGIARSYAASGTLAYAVAPAWVRTEMAEAHIESVGEDKINAALPMREITPPGDVAETVVFLASGRARHATGCTIDITGADYVR
jgi:NAD(P)-dependent dehydrogenase (short-subunit alcohol dehydrogenase family)